MANPVDPPNLDLKVDQLVDWLEFGALFSEYGVIRVDQLLGSLKQLDDEVDGNIAEVDRSAEDLVSRIENEVNLRSQHLVETYPFRLGEGAEELELDPEWRDERFVFYLVCLVTSHITGSSILRLPPTGDLLTSLRNRIFQILSTLAMSGLAGGPAVSIGWPRLRGEPIVELLQRAANAGAGFAVRRPPGPYVPPAEKDGGIDVIAWSNEMRPPPTAFYFGQAASGVNWEGKPIGEHARIFKEGYMVDLATGNLNGNYPVDVPNLMM